MCSSLKTCELMLYILLLTTIIGSGLTKFVSENEYESAKQR